MDAQGGVDAVACEVGCAVDDGEVTFFDLAVVELLGDFPLGDVVFGENHHACGVPVETMDDAGAKFAKGDPEIFRTRPVLLRLPSVSARQVQQQDGRQGHLRLCRGCCLVRGGR